MTGSISPVDGMARWMSFASDFWSARSRFGVSASETPAPAVIPRNPRRWIMFVLEGSGGYGAVQHERRTRRFLEPERDGTSNGSSSGRTDFDMRTGMDETARATRRLPKT